MYLPNRGRASNSLSCKVGHSHPVPRWWRLCCSSTGIFLSPIYADMQCYAVPCRAVPAWGGACAAQKPSDTNPPARQVTFLTLSPQPIALLSPGLRLPLAHRSVRQRQRQTQSLTLDTIQEQLTPPSFSSQLHRSEHHPPTHHSSPPGPRANRKRRLPRSKSAPSQMAQPRPCPLPRQPQNGPRRGCLVAPHWLEVPGWRFPAVLHPATIPD